MLSRACMELGESVVIKMPSILEQASKQLTIYQKETLVERFKANPYLEPGERHQLAKSLNISEKKIAKWFERRRHMKRKKGLLQKFTCKYLE